jgi:hypothetical protein
MTEETQAGKAARIAGQGSIQTRNARKVGGFGLAQHLSNDL